MVQKVIQENPRQKRVLMGQPILCWEYGTRRMFLNARGENGGDRRRRQQKINKNEKGFVIRQDGLKGL